MALYLMNSAGLTLVPTESLDKLGLKERADLQRLIRDHPESLGEPLLIIGEEFGNWEDSQRRIDLLALDQSGELVVIELKRSDDETFLDLQAIRYAAMVANMTRDDVLDALTAFMKKAGKAGDAAVELAAFLGYPSYDGIEIDSARPRIVLVAGGFSKELTTSVLWLSEIGLDIRCVRVRAADTGGAKYLDIDQVLPLPEATDFMVRAKAKAAEVAEQKTRGERTIQVLVRNGQVTTGTELVLMPKRLQHPYTPEDSTLLRAKVGEAPTAQANVIWEFDGAPYSLSHLSEILRDMHDVPLAGGGLNGYWYWARADDPSLSLWELSRQLSE